MTEIFDLSIGLIIGLINEKNNQIQKYNGKGEEEEVILGDAKMLMNM